MILNQLFYFSICQHWWYLIMFVHAPLRIQSFHFPPIGSGTFPDFKASCRLAISNCKRPALGDPLYEFPDRIESEWNWKSNEILMVSRSSSVRIRSPMLKIVSMSVSERHHIAIRSPRWRLENTDLVREQKQNDGGYPWYWSCSGKKEIKV